jgi:hypothetical protein
MDTQAGNSEPNVGSVLTATRSTSTTTTVSVMGRKKSETRKIQHRLRGKSEVLPMAKSTRNASSSSMGSKFWRRGAVEE